MTVSAGLLLYRRRASELQVLLVHPGGPFWTKKDRGAWSIPKGEVDPNEDLLACARRELREETGLRAEGPFVPLAAAKQSKKTVHAWATEGDADVTALKSNTFRLEYPPRSGKVREYPEVDAAAWFDLTTAREKIVDAQRPLLDQLERILGERR
jgi:predicted NUDIX family NTP pyrophosphohydrolase